MSHRTLATKSKVDAARDKFKQVTQNLIDEANISLQYFESHYEKFTTSLQASPIEKKKDARQREEWIEEMNLQMDKVQSTLSHLLKGPAHQAKAKIEEKKEKIEKKKSGATKLLTRLLFGWVMIFGFLAIINSGHIYVCALVAFLQILTFRELANVRYKQYKARYVPMFRTIQWGWFFTAMFYVYSDGLQGFFRGLSPQYARSVAPFHDFISFSLYATMFCITVVSFKKGFYKYQMKQLAWTFITVFMIVFQMKFAIENIKAGMFWFLLPCSLVICNDCMAYFCGKAFGKKLIKYPFMRLSPNKTWEGFIGAYLFTCIFAFVYPLVLVKSKWLICSLAELEKDPTAASCSVDKVFLPELYDIPSALVGMIGAEQVRMLPVQMHSVLLGMFASLVAPFGGFFASAIKRAYDIKDFDALIPGHGGIMDRMDCQFIMAMCTGVHYTTFIHPKVACRC
uniref:phosphatidate cytidylyltransferase n=1 Tax=Lotharella oceanica TaxID=641309 RepID=A0A7S2TMK8_9EUKA|mmetsp:Transcript_20634/g.38818  ORF Transcript_20634/g.38818 Transcript_20634/m.38818 type:complete len:454 (+) Transcript_20634:112-1473(+)